VQLAVERREDEVWLGEVDEDAGPMRPIERRGDEDGELDEDAEWRRPVERRGGEDGRSTRMRGRCVPSSGEETRMGRSTRMQSGGVPSSVEEELAAGRRPTTVERAVVSGGGGWNRTRVGNGESGMWTSRALYFSRVTSELGWALFCWAGLYYFGIVGIFGRWHCRPEFPEIISGNRNSIPNMYSGFSGSGYTGSGSGSSGSGFGIRELCPA
jgi:hypothetical protein